MIDRNTWERANKDAKIDMVRNEISSFIGLADIQDDTVIGALPVLGAQLAGLPVEGGVGVAIYTTQCTTFGELRKMMRLN